LFSSGVRFEVSDLRKTGIGDALDFPET
jgi:hypothetical protein